jgi:hypothetical protein
MASSSEQLLFTMSPSTTKPKRSASAAGLDGIITTRPVKRRASKACQCCRNRKVRCNVTEHGAPCTNCRLDEVECIVSESRRKRCALRISGLRFLFNMCPENGARMASLVRTKGKQQPPIKLRPENLHLVLTITLMNVILHVGQIWCLVNTSNFSRRTKYQY